MAIMFSFDYRKFMKSQFWLEVSGNGHKTFLALVCFSLLAPNAGIPVCHQRGWDEATRTPMGLKYNAFYMGTLCINLHNYLRRIQPVSIK